MEKEVYSQMYQAQDTFWWHKGMRKFFDVFLEKYGGGTDNDILDIGCGTGALFSVLRRYGRVWGLDASEEAVTFARRQGIAEEVVLGNAQTLPFPPGKFDIVACSDLLYHAGVADDMQVLAEIHRVLKSGGTLLIKEAAYNRLRSRMDELVHTKHRYTKPELRDKLTAARFQLVRITYIMTLLFPLAFITRKFERFFPRRYGASEIFKTGAGLNALFTWLMYAEAWGMRLFDFPFGLSIIAAARKRV